MPHLRNTEWDLKKRIATHFAPGNLLFASLRSGAWKACHLQRQLASRTRCFCNHTEPMHMPVSGFNGQRCYLSPAVEAIVRHKHEILQLIPIEVCSMKGQDWLCLHIPLASCYLVAKHHRFGSPYRAFACLKLMPQHGSKAQARIILRTEQGCLCMAE